MIENYIHQPHALNRLRSNPLGECLEEFTAYLVERGHSPYTIRLYLEAVAHFGRWLKQQRVDPASIVESTVSSFLYKHLPTCHCTFPCNRSLMELRPALRHLLEALRRTGRISVPSPPHPTPIEQKVANFEDYLRTTHGLTNNTILYRARYVRKFLQAKYSQEPLRLKDLTPRDVIKFVSDRSREYKPSTSQILCCSLRSYFRFLCLRGEISLDLSRAVPTVAPWKQTHLRSTLSDDQIDKFFSAFDRSIPTGRRDYAICLCLSELGLRASEVAGLRLNDIDWRAGTLHIASTKTHRSRLLPLPERLGRAIADYLRNGRPKSADRHVFLRHVAPKGLGITAKVVQQAITRTCSRGGLSHPLGPHRFRHTFASRMYEKGATFKEIADLLGHQQIDTVSIYAKVNLVQLSKVALPWPEVRS